LAGGRLRCPCAGAVCRAPWFAAQAANLQRNRPDTETAVFSDVGHALFVDDAARFNALMQDFIRRHVWP